MDGLRANISSSGETFLSIEFEDIDFMWTTFKTTVNSAVDKHVPTKMTSTRQTHPWVNTNLQRLMRRKLRAHQKAKRSKQARDWERYKKLQAKVHKEGSQMLHGGGSQSRHTRNAFGHTSRVNDKKRQEYQHC